MKELLVDGERFVRVSDCGEIKIVVLDRGFVYVGRYHTDGEQATIYGARSLIRWGTTKHLGELVHGPTGGTKLGESCTVQASRSKVVHTIEVEQDAWNKHIG
jgi:hypothetical protein